MENNTTIKTLEDLGRITIHLENPPSTAVDTIINNSQILIYVISLYIFFYALKPVVKAFDGFFKEQFSEEERKKLEVNFFSLLSHLGEELTKSFQRSTKKTVIFIDDLYLFNKKVNSLKKTTFLTPKTFINSFFISYIYSLIVFIVYSYDSVSFWNISQLSFGLSLTLFFFYVVRQFHQNRKDMQLFIKISILFAAISAFAVAFMDIGGIAFAIVFAGAIAVAGAGSVSGAVMFSVLFAIALTSITSYNGTILSFFENLDSLDSQTVKGVLFIFFIFIPLLNSIADWLSISVTRYEFDRLLNQDKFSYLNSFIIILRDIGWAFIFKAVILLLLLIESILFINTGAVIEPSAIILFIQKIFTLNFQEIFADSTYTIIFLMVSTTLLPTFLHLLFLIGMVIITFIIQFLSIFKKLFRGNGKFFSIFMALLSSFLVLVTFVWLEKML